MDDRRTNSGGHFNPRSRVGSDLFHLIEPETWSNFNPRSRVGSDPAVAPRPAWWYDFNPRSRVGSDLRAAYGVVRSLRISIHAPA